LDPQLARDEPGQQGVAQGGEGARFALADCEPAVNRRTHPLKTLYCLLRCSDARDCMEVLLADGAKYRALALEASEDIGQPAHEVVGVGAASALVASCRNAPTNGAIFTRHIDVAHRGSDADQRIAS